MLGWPSLDVELDPVLGSDETPARDCRGDDQNLAAAEVDSDELKPSFSCGIFGNKRAPRGGI